MNRFAKTVALGLMMASYGTASLIGVAPAKAAADCSGAASSAASENGGQVLSVSSRQQGGETVCVVTLLVQGKDGKRPRKMTVTVKP